MGDTSLGNIGVIRGVISYECSIERYASSPDPDLRCT